MKHKDEQWWYIGSTGDLKPLQKTSKKSNVFLYIGGGFVLIALLYVLSLKRF